MRAREQQQAAEPSFSMIAAVVLGVAALGVGMVYILSRLRPSQSREEKIEEALPEQREISPEQQFATTITGDI